MKSAVSRLACSFAVAALIAAFVPAVAADAAAKPAAKPAGHAVLMAASDLKWSDVPEFPGLKIAALHGDPNKGAAHFFIKMPGGFSAPMHFHNADHYGAVISGTLVLGPEGGGGEEPARRLRLLVHRQEEPHDQVRRGGRLPPVHRRPVEVGRRPGREEVAPRRAPRPLHARNTNRAAG